MASLIRSVVEEAPASAPLVGIGISVPGLVRRSDGLVRLAPNLEWHDVSFGSIVLAALGLDVPISLANDADLGALAEHERGVGVGVDDLIYVSGNVGVGAGVITAAGGSRVRAGTPARSATCASTPAASPATAATAAAGRPRSAPTRSPRPSTARRTRSPSSARSWTATTEAPRSCVPSAATSARGWPARQRLQPAGWSCWAATSARSTPGRRGVDEGLADRSLPAPLESVTLTLPGLGDDSVLLGAAEIAFEPLFVDPVAALGTALVDVRARLAAIRPASGAELELTGEEVAEGPLGGTEGGGLDAEGAGAQLGARLHGGDEPLVQRHASRGEDEVAERREVAAEHDHRRVEHREHGQPEADVAADPREPVAHRESVSARDGHGPAVSSGVASSVIPTASSIASRPIEASQQPRRPHPQTAAGSPTGM